MEDEVETDVSKREKSIILNASKNYRKIRTKRCLFDLTNRRLLVILLKVFSLECHRSKCMSDFIALICQTYDRVCI